MAGQAVLRCAALEIDVVLPWWPTDVSRSLAYRNVTELERPDKRALAIPSTITTDDYSVGYTVRTADYQQATLDGISVTKHINDLEKIARTKYPVQLILGEQVEGLFRIESPLITILHWDVDTDRPSVVDVTLTLKRASDAEVNVGLIKRVKGRGKGFAKKKR